MRAMRATVFSISRACSATLPPSSAPALASRSSRSARSRMAVSGLLTSWAMLPLISPRAAILAEWMAAARFSRSSRSARALARAIWISRNSSTDSVTTAL